jgi:hypothetical protein
VQRILQLLEAGLIKKDMDIRVSSLSYGDSIIPDFLKRESAILQVCAL